MRRCSQACTADSAEAFGVLSRPDSSTNIRLANTRPIGAAESMWLTPPAYGHSNFRLVGIDWNVGLNRAEFHCGVRPKSPLIRPAILWIGSNGAWEYWVCHHSVTPPPTLTLFYTLQ